MDKETRIEVIKAMASEMHDKQIANFADMDVEEVENFRAKNAGEIEARKRAMEEFGV